MEREEFDQEIKEISRMVGGGSGEFRTKLLQIKVLFEINEQLKEINDSLKKVKELEIKKLRF